MHHTVFAYSLDLVLFCQDPAPGMISPGAESLQGPVAPVVLNRQRDVVRCYRIDQAPMATEMIPGLYITLQAHHM